MRFLAIALVAVFLGLAEAKKDPEEGLPTPELIAYWGYPAEIFHVTTQDGYILELHRIPHGKNNADLPGPRPVIFMQHGLECASDNWVDNLPNQSAGFMFADAGFDVWLGNMRGNTYSQNHVSLNPKHDDFWAWSWDEMAQYDLDAMVDYVLKETGQDGLYYMGHSQGTLTMFSHLSKDDGSFGKKIKKFFALAPVGSVKHIKGLLGIFARDFAPELKLWFDIFGKGQFMPADSIIMHFGNMICEGLKVEKELCANLIFLIGGPESNQFNVSRVDVYTTHAPADTSAQNVLHWVQMVHEGGEPMYDYGSKKENEKAYGQKTPPSYDFTKITYPNIYIYAGDTDWLADPQDVDESIMRKLNPNLIKHYEMLHDYNHLDFIWGLRAAADIYTPIINLIKAELATEVKQ